MDERNSLASFLDRYPRLSLLTCLVIGLTLRVLAILDLRKSPYFDYLLWDERLFHIWAAKISDGTFDSSAVYESSPLPAYLIGFVYKIFSIDPTNIRIMNIGFGMLTCYLVYLVGKQLSSHKTGLLACLVACLYKPLIFYNIVPLKTSIGVFLFLLTVYFFLASFKRISLLTLFLLGLAAGLLFNVRPNAAVLIPLMPLLIIYSWNRQETPARQLAAALVLFVVGLGLVLSPFLIRNYLVANQFAMGPSQSGFNLYLGNNLANPDPYYRPVPFAQTSPRVQGIQFTVEASRRQNKQLTSSEASSYWSSEVIRMARQNPGAFARKMTQKTLVLFNQFQAGDHYNISFISKFVPFFKFPLPDLWLILPLGLTGLSMTFLNSRKSFALGLLLLTYGGTLIIFFCNTRYRLPIAVALIPLAVIGIERLVQFVATRNTKQIALWTFVCTGFVILEFLPVRATDDMTAYYNTHGLVLSARGSAEEAMQYWETSSQMEKPFSAFANISLAARYLEKQRLDEAETYLDKIPEDSFAAASKYEIVGDIAMARENVDTAISAYLSSLEINSAQLNVQRKLIKIYEKTHPDRVKTTDAELRYMESFYDSEF